MSVPWATLEMPLSWAVTMEKQGRVPFDWIASFKRKHSTMLAETRAEYEADEKRIKKLHARFIRDQMRRHTDDLSQTAYGQSLTANNASAETLTKETTQVPSRNDAPASRKKEKPATRPSQRAHKIRSAIKMIACRLRTPFR